VGDEKNNFEELERELRKSLTARDAPLGFATRVMAKADARRKRSARRVSLWRWITAIAVLAAALVVFAVGARLQQQREERLAGEHARDQVILALRITGSTLQAVNEKVQQPGKEIQP
jgi:anti-sigma-K factor RskA